MMVREYQPYKSFGPLNFGMTQAQVIEQLGKPVAVTNSYKNLEHVLDEELMGEHYISLLKKRYGMKFSDSATNNHRPELVFSDDELIEIYLGHKKDSLIVNGVDVWDKDRVTVIRQLARQEQVMLYNGPNYFFESVGVRITAPKFWKESGSIGLFSRKGFDQEMDLAEPSEYTPDEITGKER